MQLKLARRHIRFVYYRRECVCLQAPPYSQGTIGAGLRRNDPFMTQGVGSFARKGATAIVM